MKQQMSIEMMLVNCASCGMSFAITSDFEGTLRECHNTFYCPKGHHNYFPAKTDVEKLREKLAEKSSSLVAAEAQVKTLEESLAKKTPKRTKKVVTHG